jgi:hopanoid-associated phosphorylase
MILAVVGLLREARIVAGDGVRVVIGGGDVAALRTRLEQAFSEDIGGVVSFGLCGALDPALKPGDRIVASAVRDGRTRFVTDAAWSKRLSSRLPHAVSGTIAGSDVMLTTRDAKAALHGSSGAVAVDMESHITARFAARHGLPLAVIRAVSDGADHALPTAAQRGMRPDGSMDIGAVIAALAVNPLQLPALIRTGLEAEKGFSALVHSHHLLGPALGLGELGHHSLDVT